MAQPAADLPRKSESLWSDLYHYLLQKPEKETLIAFETPAKRKEFTQRVMQRLDISVEQYAVLNIHKIGIDVPGGHIFEELLTWNRDSVYWPNRLACIKRLEGRSIAFRYFSSASRTGSTITW